MLKKFSLKLNDVLTTLGGISLAALIGVVSKFDFNNFNAKSINDWMKLIAMISAALGGNLSILKTKPVKEALEEKIEENEKLEKLQKK